MSNTLEIKQTLIGYDFISTNHTFPLKRIESYRGNTYLYFHDRIFVCLKGHLKFLIKENDTNNILSLYFFANNNLIFQLDYSNESVHATFPYKKSNQTEFFTNLKLIAIEACEKELKQKAKKKKSKIKKNWKAIKSIFQ